MKIAINARLLNERRGGPYRYLVNILTELAEIDKENTYYLILNSVIDQNLKFTAEPNFKQVVFPFKNRIIFDYICLPIFSYLNKMDLYFFPKNTFSPLVKGRKIPVFHDIIYFENFKFREFKYFDHLHHKLMIPFSGKLSDFNISVSHFTAERMNKLLGLKQDNICVITEGVEGSFRVIKNKEILESVITRYNLKKPFLFFSGSLSPRKNILNLIKAFELLKDRIPHNLYFTAGESWNDSDIYRYIHERNLESRIIKLGFLPEEDLVGLYNLADCYLYVSLYEGFGLPILEAQACGCPVITSNVSSCPEVAGEGALLVDPTDPQKISEAILKIVGSNSFRSSLVKAGLENIKRFSWKKAAKEHLELFKRIVEF